MNALLKKLGISLPIIQAPMAGTSTPAMAAAVCNAGGLGSLGVGAVDAEKARGMIGALRAATNRPFNVNVFCHEPPLRNPTREAAWVAALAPTLAQFGAQPPPALTPPRRSVLFADELLYLIQDDT